MVSASDGSAYGGNGQWLPARGTALPRHLLACASKQATWRPGTVDEEKRRKNRKVQSCLKLRDYEFESRLIIGTGKFSDVDTMIKAINASGTQLVTVALRRFNRE